MQSIVGAEVLASVLKDTTGAQIITKTLDKLNPGTALPGAAINTDQQFQRDMLLNAAGIGNKLNTIA